MVARFQPASLPVEGQSMLDIHLATVPCFTVIASGIQTVSTVSWPSPNLDEVALRPVHGAKYLRNLRPADLPALGFQLRAERLRQRRDLTDFSNSLTINRFSQLPATPCWLAQPPSSPQPARLHQAKQRLRAAAYGSARV